MPDELATDQETGQETDISEHKALWHWTIGDRSCRHHFRHAFHSQELAPSLPPLLWNKENVAPFSPHSTHTKQSNCGLKRKESGFMWSHSYQIEFNNTHFINNWLYHFFLTQTAELTTLLFRKRNNQNSWSRHCWQGEIVPHVLQGGLGRQQE